MSFYGVINVYTESVRVNCRDINLTANLYSNRTAAHLIQVRSCNCQSIFSILTVFCVIQELTYQFKTILRSSQCQYIYDVEVILGVLAVVSRPSCSDLPFCCVCSFFAGNYTEALNDASTATTVIDGLPSLLKALLRYVNCPGFLS